MERLKDKLWNWGHLEKSHNNCTLLKCNMTPEEFGEYYHVKNSFIISYGGNIQPPFDEFAKRFSVLNNIKWSVVGDSSSPVSQNEMGDTEYIIDVSKKYKNITGAVMDDFFSKDRMKRFPVEVLEKIHKKLNNNGLDFWCVLYDYQLKDDLKQYLECFDGVSFWLWGCEKILNIDEYIDKFFKLINNKKNMLGIYLWDYKDVGKQPMNSVLFKKQLTKYFDYIRTHKTDGVIICSNTIGDADLETNKILKDYINEYGNDLV